MRKRDFYELYVTYEINGTVCQDVYYKTESSDSLLGSQVLIEVDPADPTVIRPEEMGLFVPAFSALVMAGAGLGLVVSVAGHLTERAMGSFWGEHYAGGRLTPEKVREDVEFEAQTVRTYRRRLAGALLVVAAVCCAIDGLVRGTTTAYYAFLPPAALAAAAAWALTLRQRGGEVELQETQVEEILDRRDSDGDMIRRQRLTGLGEMNVRQCLLVTRQGRRWNTELRSGAEFIVATVGGKPDRFYSVQEFQLRNE